MAFFHSVAGGPKWFLAYLAMGMGVAGYFIFSVVQASESWSQPVLVQSFEYGETEYPDMYVCINAIKNGGHKQNLRFETLPVESDPSSLFPSGFRLRKSSVAAQEYRTTRGRTANGYVSKQVTVGSVGSEWSNVPWTWANHSNGKDIKITDFSNKSAVLSSMLPKFDHYDEAVCYYFEAEVDATQSTIDAGSTEAGFEIYTGDGVTGEVNVFLTARGTLPYQCKSPPQLEDIKNCHSSLSSVLNSPKECAKNCVINATHIIVDGLGSRDRALLSPEKFQNRIEFPDGGIVTTYKYNLLTKVHDTRVAEISISMVGSVVPVTIVREKTFSEILSDIGGLVAFSLAVFGFFFSKSGHLDSRLGHEVMIFNCLPKLYRESLLVGTIGKHVVDSSEEEKHDSESE